MSNHGCINGSLAGMDYSAPVPAVGVYIAVGSLTCLVLMLYDVIVAGILPRKRWLPCMYFKFDSLSLTLLSIAAKVTVDLTSPMPNHWDQLAKLTGTAFTCVCMGFLAPSIGDNSESEGFTNMMALTIFVTTITVNISIQLHTGVIVRFFIEHVIILILMWVLVLVLWHIYLSIKHEKKIDADAYRYLLTKGPPGMFDRLKLGSLYARCSNPQFKISTYAVNVTVAIVCIGCAAIVAQAAFMSIILKKRGFCGGDSDYGWMMPYIVIIQMITVILAPIPVVARCVALFGRMDWDSIFVSFLPHEDFMVQMNQTLRFKMITLHTLRHFLRSTLTKVVLIIQLMITFPLVLVHQLLSVRELDQNLEYFGDFSVAATRYRVRKCLDDMIRLKEQVESSESMAHFSHFLSKNRRTRYLDLHAQRIKDGYHHIEVCSLSMVLLVKTAQVSLPKHLLVSLVSAFCEAKEIIHYIDDVLEVKSSENKVKLAYARSAWIDGDFSRVLRDYTEPGSDIVVAIETINKLKAILISGPVWYQLHTIIDFINRKPYRSVEELYREIEGLFVDMLHAILARLPTAIYNILRQAPAEKFEKETQVAMRFLLQIGSMECQSRWFFPGGMTRMVSYDGDGYDAMEFPGELERLGHFHLNAGTGTGTDAVALKLQELEQIKMRLKEMEEKAASFKEMQAKIEKEIASTTESIKNEVDSRSVYVGNVHYACTPEEVQQHFQSCGTVNRVTISTNQVGQAMGYAFVEFLEFEAVQVALQLDESELHGRQLKVSPARRNEAESSIRGLRASLVV